MSCCGTCAATGGSCSGGVASLEKRKIGALAGDASNTLTTVAVLSAGTIGGWWLGGQVNKGTPARVIGAVVGLLLGRSLLA